MDGFNNSFRFFVLETIWSQVGLVQRFYLKFGGIYAESCVGSAGIKQRLVAQRRGMSRLNESQCRNAMPIIDPCFICEDINYSFVECLWVLLVQAPWQVNCRVVDFSVYFVFNGWIHIHFRWYRTGTWFYWKFCFFFLSELIYSFSKESFKAFLLIT